MPSSRPCTPHWKQKCIPATWALMLIANTGARCGEAANITQNEIEMERDEMGNAYAIWTIPASRTKAHKDHSYKLTTPEQILIARNAASANWEAGVHRANSTRVLYQKLVKRHGLTWSGPHALRRYVATEIATKLGLETARDT